MTIDEFIEKAKEGGWEPKREHTEYAGMSMEVRLNDGIFLDPLLWQAVGKTEGWSGWIAVSFDEKSTLDIWEYNMHRLTDALAEGKSIQEFLATL